MDEHISPKTLNKKFFPEVFKDNKQTSKHNFYPSSEFKVIHSHLPSERNFCIVWSGMLEWKAFPLPQ